MFKTIKFHIMITTIVEFQSVWEVVLIVLFRKISLGRFSSYCSSNFNHICERKGLKLLIRSFSI